MRNNFNYYMKSIRCIIIFLTLLTCYGKVFSQVTSIPPEAKENFARQYPDAEDVQWENDIVNVKVHFGLGNSQMNAEYSNKGIWKNTYKDWTYEQLPLAVTDGFQKSKYAEREVTDVRMIYLPGDVVQYRMKVEKNNVQKKYVFYNSAGRLVREVNTL